MTCNTSLICGLESRREALGWPLDKLGRRCLIDRTFLSDREQGRGSPRLEAVQQWAAALDLILELARAGSECRRGLLIDWDKRCAKVDGTPIRLAPMEWKALERLARTPGELVTHQALFRHLYCSVTSMAMIASIASSRAPSAS
jgi:transcriptional regulator with XRE-family HTH domain